MILPVEHVDGHNKTHSLKESISLLAFLKHAALAGQGRGTLFPTLTRGIGLLLYYQYYIKVGQNLSFNGFVIPTNRDPTELGDFSTIAGKAFADILAKRILFAPFTFTYEAALLNQGMPIKGERPDFYCSSPNGDFSLESKGNSNKRKPKKLINDAKNQSKKGGIKVCFSYASVSYNLYGNPQCCFHDPVQRDTPVDHNLHRNLINAYYRSILHDLTEHKQVTITRKEQQDFIVYPFTSKWGSVEFLVNREIENHTRRENLGFERINTEHLYVDSDGIGISIL